ncbi:hypothetical protein GQX74_011158 [Glossina fuscipes]|nr:hypothetical protein GQX74_011158 [Glossina fuscipes]
MVDLRNIQIVSPDILSDGIYISGPSTSDHARLIKQLEDANAEKESLKPARIKQCLASAALIKDCFSGFVHCTPSFGSNSKWSLPPIKLPVLIEKLLDPSLDFRFNIKVILTEHAKHFLDLASMLQSADLLDD